MKWISLVCVLCLLQLASAICECSNGQQSFIPSRFDTHPPSAFNDTDGSASSFGSTCEDFDSFYQCNNNTDNPLFDCSASNNSYYRWNGQFLSVSAMFSNHFQSINVSVIFLVSTASNVSVPTQLHYSGYLNEQFMLRVANNPPASLPEGPYQHSYTLSHGEEFNQVIIYIYPNTTFQWVAINRIIFCPVTTEVQSSSTPLMSMSSSSLTTVSTMLLTVSPSTESATDEDDLVSIAIISAAVIGTSLLIIVIIVMVIMMKIVCSRRRKESRRTYNIDDNNVTVKLSSHAPNTQQHTSNTSGVKVDPTSKPERVNALYIPTEVKSLDSLLRRLDASDVIGSDVIITPNPSYNVGPNLSDTAKNCEYQYDYVQTDDGLFGHNKVVGSTTSGRVYDEITDHADNVSIDPNPSYSLAQDIKLEDNPSYDKLQL